MTRNANRMPPLAEAKDENADAELDEVAGGFTSEEHGATSGSGSGDGKITFNPFSITRKID